jgi:hypothetical protein
MPSTLVTTGDAINGAHLVPSQVQFWKIWLVVGLSGKFSIG